MNERDDALAYADSLMASAPNGDPRILIAMAYLEGKRQILRNVAGCMEDDAVASRKAPSDA